MALWDHPVRDWPHALINPADLFCRRKHRLSKYLHVGELRSSRNNPFGQMSTVVRLRRRPLVDAVQNLDVFPKVTENVQEEKKTCGGLITVISFILISWLVIGELRFYMQKHYSYKFAVDTDFNARMSLDVDLVVNMPCSLIGADVVGLSEESITIDPFRNQLRMDPTRFDLTQTEQTYWDILRQAQSQLSRVGDRNYQSLEQLSYVGNSVIKGLQKAADQKQKEESKRLQADRPGDSGSFRVFFGGGDGPVQVVMGGGGLGGIFDLLHGGGHSDKGTACRVHGQVPVHKVAGNLHITPGKTLPLMGGGGHAHLNVMGTERDYNFSHRIERFSFGPRISGLVMPLAGTEKISADNMDLYQYYLKIVPTKIYHSGTFVDSVTTAYQYALTHQKRAIHHSKGSHGIPGINFKYELSSVMIEVREKYRSVFELLIRLCAIVGGVFATSGVINSLVATVVENIYGKPPSKADIPIDRKIGATFDT